MNRSELREKSLELIEQIIQRKGNIDKTLTIEILYFCLINYNKELNSLAYSDKILIEVNDKFKNINIEEYTVNIEGLAQYDKDSIDRVFSFISICALSLVYKVKSPLDFVTVDLNEYVISILRLMLANYIDNYVLDLVNMDKEFERIIPIEERLKGCNVYGVAGSYSVDYVLKSYVSHGNKLKDNFIKSLEFIKDLKLNYLEDTLIAVENMYMDIVERDSVIYDSGTCSDKELLEYEYDNKYRTCCKIKHAMYEN